ncbi:MaoC family dehydratase [Bradyrhizobium sp. AS23.2]|uniref:MaoC family dehydratase n=1 Tax=Bradyrhizobium sp. AS23.2 TaxID=1680155 RepID=UPI00093A68C5|nr:MaoC family dehydratase [Bradyrhizobium sp. AS23.2]OKO83626.1 hypothetical protein AC630_10765 [Bradyrhizobium sp. AS23.2]
MSVPEVGDRTEQELLLDVATIRAGAHLVGDFNPLHHDETVAASSRFGGIIASGAHTSALLAGLATRGFGKKSADDRGGVGVDYSVQFLAPALAGRTFRMEWSVATLERRKSGTIGRLEGKIVDTTDDVTVLTGKMTVLYFS